MDEGGGLGPPRTGGRRTLRQRRLVSLTGSLRINSYEQDGAKHRILELHATSVAPALDPSVSMNDAVLLGRVRSVESKTIPNGTAMTIVSVGTNTKQNGKDREDYHSVTLWAKTAERGAKEIAGGDLISINGAVRHRSVPGPDADEVMPLYLRRSDAEIAWDAR